MFFPPLLPRHGVADSMNSVLMRLILLQRGVHKPEPDLQAITQGMLSPIALTKPPPTAALDLPKP